MRSHTIAVTIVNDYDGSELWSDEIDLAMYIAFSGQGPLIDGIEDEQSSDGTSETED